MASEVFKHPAGGVSKDSYGQNPAWDFQMIISKYDVINDYGFRARIIYRERYPGSVVAVDTTSGGNHSPGVERPPLSQTATGRPRVFSNHPVEAFP